MTNNEIGKDVPTFLYQKLWEIYLLTNEKRVKSFFYLITSIVILLIILFGEKNNVDFLGTNIDRTTAIFIFPIFIFILSFRYFTLSALSINNHNKFNGYFEEYRDKVFPNDAIKFSNFKSENLRSDDINEFPNMFLIPVQLDKSNKVKFPTWIKEPLKYMITILLWIFHCSAILLYTYLFLGNMNYKGNVILVILTGGLIITIIYFLLGTNIARKELIGDKKGSDKTEKNSLIGNQN